MYDIWFISDTHFFHSNMLKFVDKNGQRVRHQYQSIEEMHEDMIAKWNARVKPEDHIWHIGDVTFRYDGAFNNLMSRLNGHKRLTPGNHDKMKNPNLFRWFDKVALWREFKEYNFTAVHIPLRLDSLHKSEFCVHGHIHQKVLSDPHYINICVEHTDYAPIHLDEIRARIAAV